MAKFKFKSGDRVATAEGKHGEVQFRDAGSQGHQNRYAVETDNSGTIVYFEEELEKDK